MGIAEVFACIASVLFIAATLLAGVRYMISKEVNPLKEDIEELKHGNLRNFDTLCDKIDILVDKMDEKFVTKDICIEKHKMD